MIILVHSLLYCSWVVLGCYGTLTSTRRASSQPDNSARCIIIVRERCLPLQIAIAGKIGLPGWACQSFPATSTSLVAVLLLAFSLQTFPVVYAASQKRKRYITRPVCISGNGGGCGPYRFNQSIIPSVCSNSCSNGNELCDFIGRMFQRLPGRGKYT